MDTLEGDSLFTKRSSLFKAMDSIEEPSTCPWKFPVVTPDFKEIYLEKAELLLSLLEQNQVLRWKFKRFFTMARIKRFPRLNDQDPITLEPFNQPISVPMFSLRKTYVFEAKSFAKFSHKQLLTNDGHIPTPVYPKNPLTNEEFPLGQLISLFTQCKRLGYTSWTMESFVRSRFELARLLVLQHKSLRLHALRATMANRKSWDCIDTVYDFIRSQHLANNVPFQKLMYKWALSYANTCPRIETWRRLCIKWYELDILTDDLETKEEHQTALRPEILKACRFPEDLTLLHSQRVK